jgi:hypothetical protein
MAHRAHRPHNFRALSKPKPVQKSHHKHYWPYIPLLVMVIATVVMNMRYVGNANVLAYATNMSVSGLLEATNNRRAQANVGNVQINNTLSAAAQTKANDMVTRNYWSHNTPDGQEPWVFINNAGYKYLKAGENLAYGFLTSTDTVTGWMNSEPHRVNMLDGNYTEVGFGFVNSENFNNHGEQTIVVAMYGQPQVQSATANAQPTPQQPSSQPSVPAPEVTIQPANPASLPSEPVAEQSAGLKPITSDAPVRELPVQSVARIQALTNGNAPWTSFALGLVSGLIVMLLLVRHAAALRHLLRDSEKFILHHPLLDTILVSIVFISSLLSQTTGFIR